MQDYKKTATVKIEYVEDEHEESRDFEPSFWYRNKRWYLGDFVKTRSPFVSSWVFPDYIDAFDPNEYFNPIFIRLIDDETIEIYEEV